MVATTIAPSSMKRKQIQTLFLTGLILSFIGWVWETIFSFILHSPNDRGFLVLPFCTIYGFALIFIYLLFGTPSDMHLFGHSIFPNHAFPRYLAYFFSSALLATAIELVTAAFFESFFGIKLWSYTFLPGGESEFIALLPSLFWGVAITLFMRFLFQPIHLAVGKIQPKILSGLFWVFLIAVLADLTFNFVYLSVNGTHYVLPFFD